MACFNKGEWCVFSNLDDTVPLFIKNDSIISVDGVRKFRSIPKEEVEVGDYVVVRYGLYNGNFYGDHYYLKSMVSGGSMFKIHNIGETYVQDELLFHYSDEMIEAYLREDVIETFDHTSDYCIDI